MSELSQCLVDLANAAESLWQQYLDRGPGNMPVDRLHFFQQKLFAARKVLDQTVHLPREEWMLPFQEATWELESLLTQCVERTEGLCFVTGEAGLIPRRDLHQRCENALRKLRELPTVG